VPSLSTPGVRDKTSLSAMPQLWPSIEEALSRSRFFLLLASPEAASSHWIDEEVRWWRAHRSHDTLLIVLTAGELGWDGAPGDFASDAIPPGLRGWLRTEPPWVDLRWVRGERDLSMRNPRFRDAVADLAAPLRGVPKDELIGEDIDRHRRTVDLQLSSPINRCVPHCRAMESVEMHPATAPSARSTKWWARQMLNKVPEITVYFWVIKLLCTTVGETFADNLNENLGLGLTNTSYIMSALLAVVLAFQFRARKYVPGIYWLAVVLISVVGTLVSDNLVENLGVGLETTTIAFSAILICVFAS
jgi:hypothetical protein